MSINMIARVCSKVAAVYIPVSYTNPIVVSLKDPMVGDYSVASKLIGDVPYYDPTVVDIWCYKCFF